MTKFNPFKYNGSGVYWKRHIRKHGVNLVKTLDVYGFDDQNMCSYFALKFSKDNNIVKSKDWANLVDENGLITTTSGLSLNTETKRKISKSLIKYNKENAITSKLKGVPLSKDHKEKIRSSMLNITNDPNYISPTKGLSPWNKNKKGVQIAWNKDIKTGPNSKESNIRRSETLKLFYKNKSGNRLGADPWNKGLNTPGSGKNFNSTRFVCEHCDKYNLNAGNYNRWHGNNCKLRPTDFVSTV